LISLDLKTSGFFKESVEEEKFKSLKENINNLYLARYDITSEKITGIDMRMNKVSESDEKMDFISSAPNRAEDIPNMYLTNIRQLKFTNDGIDDLNVGLKRKLENLKIYIDGILP